MASVFITVIVSLWSCYAVLVERKREAKGGERERESRVWKEIKNSVKTKELWIGLGSRMWVFTVETTADLQSSIGTGATRRPDETLMRRRCTPRVAK